jgi:hypothetical protein
MRTDMEDGQNENALGGGTDEKQEPSLGAIHAPSPPFASQPLVKVREQGLEASDWWGGAKGLEEMAEMD